MAKKQKNVVSITTPKAPTKYRVELPFEYEGSIKYKIEVLLDPQNPEHKLFIDKMLKFQEKKRQEILAQLTPAKKAKTTIYMPLSEDFDENGEPTGLYVFKANSGFPPLLIDAKKQPIPYNDEGGKKVFKTGKAIVRFKTDVSTEPYIKGMNAGVTSYVKVIQIIEVLDSGFTADLSDFDEEEGVTVDDLVNEVNSIDTGFSPEEEEIDEGDY